MSHRSLLKPEYILRPRQIPLRIIRALRPPPLTAVVSVPWGVDLEIRPRETAGVSAALWRLGIHDLALSEVLWRLTSPGALVVDGGANIGYTASILALRSGPGGRVLAFEPQPAVHADLVANIARLRDARFAPITAFRQALGPAPGSSFFSDGPEFATNRGTGSLTSDPTGGRPVEVTSLDQVLGGRPAEVIKLDLEGGELEALQGASESLGAQRIDHVIVEAHPRYADGLRQFLQARGYTWLPIGRTWRGPLVSEGARDACPPWEPQNAIATLQGPHVIETMSEPGWQVLRSHSARILNPTDRATA